MDKRKTYEGMFLLDSIGQEFEVAAEPVRKVLGRSEAEILACKPWDERKLAYTIAGRKRGIYALAYFKVDPSRVAEIEHDCQLDEQILRLLILRRDDLTEAEISSETPAMTSARKAAERREAKAAEEAEAAAAEAQKREEAEGEAKAAEGEADEESDEEEAADEESSEGDDDEARDDQETDR